MQEHQVTVDGVTHKLPEPFLVLATQNPVDFVGTYPLPEAQLDRFFMRVSLGYPTKEEEARVLDLYMTGAKPLDTMEPVCTAADILQLQQDVNSVKVSKEMRVYIASIAQASRNASLFARGISTRGAIALMHSAQACALLSGRDYVTPEDIRKMACPVLSHRLILNPEFKIGTKGMTNEKALQRLLANVQVPVRVK